MKRNRQQSPMNQPPYIPFGPEWEAEVMKTPKKYIVTLLREALLAARKGKP